MILVKDFKAWRPDDGTNIWELSGLFQGDIMSYENDVVRHGVLNDSLRWNHGIVPYEIVEDDFSKFFKLHKIKLKNFSFT